MQSAATPRPVVHVSHPVQILDRCCRLESSPGGYIVRDEAGRAIAERPVRLGAIAAAFQVLHGGGIT